MVIIVGVKAVAVIGTLTQSSSWSPSLSMMRFDRF